ncbi:MAG: carbohydrate ABC transporter permease [Lachnospiraceae bacterium]|nr:carbohydrate ABC transporter permease [Lachnospiraceae bacterium]
MRRLKNKKIKSIIFQIFFIFVGLIIAFPIIYSVSASFMKATDIVGLNPRIIPKSFTLKNYKEVLESTNIIRQVFNSLLITVMACALRLLVAALAAFGFSFYEFPFKKLFFYLTICTMLIPGEATLLTNYETVSKMHMVNTYAGSIIMFIGSGTSVFIIRQYFLTLPKSLHEAAVIDGCSDFRFFCTIVMPLSKPVLSAAAINGFVQIWNQYIWPKLMATRTEMFTVQVGLAQLNSTQGSSYGVILAAAVIALLPTLLFFIFFQKQIAGGMVAGSIKE